MRCPISVCMAIKNGEAFLAEQLHSILPQLGSSDEIVISDDHSTDESQNIIAGLSDRRIKCYSNPGNGLMSNFENALRNAEGEYIFLADQDDVWKPNKVSVMLQQLKTCDLVISDCELTDRNLHVSGESFFVVNGSGRGILKNLVRNSYMGCCMAFHRDVLTRALPFPAGIPMHDLWIGMVADLHFRVSFIPDRLLLHRRHDANASSTGSRSQHSWGKRIAGRLALMKNLVESTYAR